VRRDIPKITIIMATYNRATFIVETLESIRNQIFTDWECLIIDDGGTDNTSAVIAPILEQDTRFQFLKRPETYLKGLPGCRNYGLDLARGNYIQFFDDDDLMHPKKLEFHVEPFLKNVNLNFTVSKFEILVESVDNSIKIIRPEFKLDHSHVGDAILLGDLKINSLSALWNINTISKFRFDETLKYAEEWELFTRIGYNYPDNYGIVNEYLFTYRKHANTLTLGVDLNYEKRMTSSIIRIKILDYLTKNKLHTKKSILFLSKTFLIVSYNPEYVRGMLEYLETIGGFSYKLRWFLIAGLIFAKFNRKLITKVASWV
jgi:GalNAc5-diNAcBac-PP-undecaprenol beta-1,3-glucosyltransferase